MPEPYYDRWQQQQAAEHARHEATLAALEGLAAAYAVHKLAQEHQQRVQWEASLPPQQRAEYRAARRGVRLHGLLLLAIATGLIAIGTSVTGPAKWIGTAGVVLAFIGAARVIWAGE
jgi:anti-sigma factor RsiW